MAIFRKIHVTFWSDSYTSELKEKEKLFYLYLLTNDRTTQLGCYEITKKQMSFDLGYTIDTVSILLKKFEKDGKIRYNTETCEIALKNWNKYNKNDSIKVQSLVNKEVSKIKDRSLIEYLYSIDTVSIPNPQEEEEQEEEQEEEIEQEKTKEEIYMSFDHLSITVEDFEKLCLIYGTEKVLAVFDDIRNYKKNKNYTSLYLTANKWLKKNETEPPKLTVLPNQNSRFDSIKRAGDLAENYLMTKYAQEENDLNV